jgi:transcriptional regulator with XRE-family HTH domain
MRVGLLLENWRFINKLKLREAGAIVGISASTLMHIEKGKVPDGPTLLKLQAWLFGADPQPQSEVVHEEEPEVATADAGN